MRPYGLKPKTKGHPSHCTACYWPSKFKWKTKFKGYEHSTVVKKRARRKGRVEIRAQLNGE